MFGRYKTPPPNLQQEIESETDLPRLEDTKLLHLTYSKRLRVRQTCQVWKTQNSSSSQTCQVWKTQNSSTSHRARDWEWDRLAKFGRHKTPPPHVQREIESETDLPSLEDTKLLHLTYNKRLRVCLTLNLLLIVCLTCQFWKTQNT